MPVIDLLREMPAPTMLPPLWASSDPADASVVDLSGLTPQEHPDVQGFAWVELPLLGEDGLITGVLCQRSRIAAPCAHAARSGDEAVRVYVHDIANLLAVIDGGLRLLDVKTGDDRATIVERLHRAVERGATMSRRLLDAVRPESEPRGRASHEKVVVDLSDLLDRTLRPDVVVDTIIDPGLRRFSIDPEALQLALLNFCKNASDAMPDGGTISISARNICARPDGTWVEIAVSDDGIGMAPEVLSRAFEPYFTTKDAGKGTGLGLDQVRRFVESSRGAISVDSVENKGTIVWMFFPSR